MKMKKDEYNILAVLDAYIKCITQIPQNEVKAMEHHHSITAWLKATLPHGSGIDNDWVIDVAPSHQPTNILCHNSFHYMNPDGVYDGWYGFTVFIHGGKRDIWGNVDWRIIMSKQDSKTAEIKEYLNDLFVHCMDV